LVFFILKEAVRADALKAVTDSSENSSFLIRHGDAAEYRAGPAPLPGTVWINYNDHVLGGTPNINFVNPINSDRNTQLRPNFRDNNDQQQVQNVE
jgi:hypothetical protein